MQTNIYTLNKEVECLKQQLYDLLDNEPWAKHDILRISKRLDDLILQFYSFN
ncbi:aspartyl-phosphate phosphatase Spo0E family protein [Clostridium sp. BNL1100]|uniref:aspartyl-phosphate phosphatase Spo0E family protein n=1 Tax=Clostridium sp. BNL1100 TaxID=755731 RepID=UPI0005A23EE6|nr:aspartyl-phosphate phosphatase Spo0E family protein [Clostridium sp. BNL1100]